MRIFASERVSAIMQRLGMQDGEAIESNLVSKAIENAQRKVEAHNFDIRKHLLEYDDVANDQRKVIYEWRNDLLDVDDISEDVKNMRLDIVNDLMEFYIPTGSFDETWDVNGLSDAIEHEFNVRLEIANWIEQDQSLHEEPLKERIEQEIEAFMEERQTNIPQDLMRRIEKISCWTSLTGTGKNILSQWTI